MLHSIDEKRKLDKTVDYFKQQDSAAASTSSSLQLLIYIGLGIQPFSLQAILNSCTLGFQDVMKCSGPFGELGRRQYNYTEWSLMSYSVITSLPPEAKAGWTCSRGFIKRGERETGLGSFSLCICCFFVAQFSHFSSRLQAASDVHVSVRLVSAVSNFSCLICKHTHFSSLHDMRKHSGVCRTMKYYAWHWLSLDRSYYSGS